MKLLGWTLSYFLQFFEVRQNAVCVVGLHRDAVRDIKNQIGTLLKVPIPLESFHVKSPSDIKVNIGKQIIKIKPTLSESNGIQRVFSSLIKARLSISLVFQKCQNLGLAPLLVDWRLSNGGIFHVKSPSDIVVNIR